MKAKKKCNFLKPDGRKCEAWAMINSDFCFLHNPDISEILKKSAQSRGGQANKIKISEPLEPMAIENPKDVIKLLEDIANRVRMGKMELKVANSLGFVAGLLLKGFEVNMKYEEKEQPFRWLEKIQYERKQRT